jgi:hypothetical protein
MSESDAAMTKREQRPEGISLRLPGGLGIGLQGGTVALLLFIGSEARSAFEELQRQQQESNAKLDEKVRSLDDRLVALELSVKDIGSDKSKVADLAAQIAALEQELELIRTCVRDKRRCK